MEIRTCYVVESPFILLKNNFMPINWEENLTLNTTKEAVGKVGYSSPSNIALVKYWGKYGDQLPQNPSISFTLDYARTEMVLNFSPKENVQKSNDIDLTFSFEGQNNLKFEEKIRAFFKKLLPSHPYLGQLSFDISSSNSFPHSAGIASSASSMSALALCICSLENKLFNHLKDHEFLEKASFLARLASGSACRSVFPLCASWGKSSSIPSSSNECGTPLAAHLNPVFKTYKDAILLVSKKEKNVSSRAGHKLMEDNPFASTRYNQANQHIGLLMNALALGDLDTFIQITELEAMTLHALMMSSSPYFLLLEPNTIRLIKKIRAFREETKIPVCFTLDAGPNIHLLYPEAFQDAVSAFIQDELSLDCEQNKWISDQVGDGQIQIF